MLTKPSDPRFSGSAHIGPPRRTASLPILSYGLNVGEILHVYISHLRSAKTTKTLNLVDFEARWAAFQREAEEFGLTLTLTLTLTLSQATSYT